MNSTQNRLSRRAFLGIAGGLAAGVPVLASCGSSGGNSNANANSSGGKSIDMWLIDTGAYGPLFDTMKKYEQQKGVKINVTTLPNTLAGKQKLIIGMTAQKPPVVVVTGGSGNLKPYVASKKVIPLDAALTSANPNWKTEYLPLGLKQGTYDGTVYGIPLAGTQPDFMFYSKPVYDHIGLQAPTTYAQLKQNAAVAKGKGLIPFSLGNESGWPGLIWFEFLATRIGGPEPFERVVAGDSSAWTDPSFVSAIDEMQKLIKANYFQPGFESVDWANGVPDALLVTGKSSMEFMVNFLYNLVGQKYPQFMKDGSLGWFDFPVVQGGKGKTTDLIGNVSLYASITAASTDQEKEIAADFLATVPVSKEYAEAGLKASVVPLSKATGEALKTYSGPAADMNKYTYDAVINATSYQTSWDNAIPGSQQNALFTNLGNVFTLEWDGQKFAEEMSKAGS